jgi:hypothetical protein
MPHGLHHHARCLLAALLSHLYRTSPCWIHHVMIRSEQIAGLVTSKNKEVVA